MTRFWPALIKLTCGVQFAYPLLVSTGVHTTLLVGLGLAVAGSMHDEPRPASVAMAVGLGTGGSGGELDATPIDAPGYAAGDEGVSDDAGASLRSTQMEPGDVQLAAASLRATVEDELFGALTSPIDMLAADDHSTSRAWANAGATSAGSATGSAEGKASHGTSGSGAGKAGKRGGSSGGKGSGKAGKAAGGYASEAGFFGLSTSANKVVFIVDISGSMQGRRIRRAQTELRHTLEALKPSQKFFVVFFSDGAMAMPAEGLLTATRDNVVAAWQWIKSAECGGGTNPLPAVLLALELKPDAIYLLTDGKFEPQVFYAATEAPPGQRTPIHTIGFATKKAERLLQAIANETGGSYRFVP